MTRVCSPIAAKPATRPACVLLLPVYEGKAVRGLAGTAFVALYFLIAKTVEKTLLVFEKIQSGEAPLDAATISELVSNQTTGTETQLLRIATAALIISWLIGIVDSYRVGRAQAKEIDAVS